MYKFGDVTKLLFTEIIQIPVTGALNENACSQHSCQDSYHLVLFANLLGEK
jgi:hypothetical protein